MKTHEIITEGPIDSIRKGLSKTKEKLDKKKLMHVAKVSAKKVHDLWISTIGKYTPDNPELEDNDPVVKQDAIDKLLKMFVGKVFNENDLSKTTPPYNSGDDIKEYLTQLVINRAKDKFSKKMTDTPPAGPAPNSRIDYLGVGHKWNGSQWLRITGAGFVPATDQAAVQAAWDAANP